MDAGHNQLFLPLTPEKAAIIALGLNVRLPNQWPPEFYCTSLTESSASQSLSINVSVLVPLHAIFDFFRMQLLHSCIGLILSRMVQ